MQYKAGFIGCGNMGGALARATAKSIDGNQVAVCDYDSLKTEALKAELSATPIEANELIENSQFVFLGIKPQMMEKAISPLVETINGSDCVVVTMAAGLCIEYFEKALGITRPIIRIMPNTPCSVGEGMILYSCNSKVTSDIEKEFLNILSCSGKLDKIPEGLIDAASAVSGCGPAFASIFAEALADAAVACGVPRDKALLYSAQMLKGTAELILSGEHPAVLKDKVCSPGGTTIAGVRALEEHGMRAAAINAVSAAYLRTLELKK